MQIPEGLKNKRQRTFLIHTDNIILQSSSPRGHHDLQSHVLSEIGTNLAGL